LVKEAAVAPLKCANRTEFKMAEKAGLRRQVFSKWKPEPRGIEEEAVTRSGTWLDAKRVREEREKCLGRGHPKRRSRSSDLSGPE